MDKYRRSLGHSLLELMIVLSISSGFLFLITQLYLNVKQQAGIQQAIAQRQTQLQLVDHVCVGMRNHSLG